DDLHDGRCDRQSGKRLLCTILAIDEAAMSKHPTHTARLLAICAFVAGPAFGAATMPSQFNPNSMTTGWIGEVEFTSFDFRWGNECLIKGDYRRADWSGNVIGIPVDAAGNLQLAAQCWSNDFADAVNQQAATNTRYIGTMKSDGTKIPFQWDKL